MYSLQSPNLNYSANDGSASAAAGCDAEPSVVAEPVVALLEPREMMNQFEIEGDFSSRLALQDELKSMPFSAVWDYFCSTKNIPVGMDLMSVIKDYEKKVMSLRGG